MSPWPFPSLSSTLTPSMHGLLIVMNMTMKNFLHTMLSMKHSDEFDKKDRDDKYQEDEYIVKIVLNLTKMIKIMINIKKMNIETCIPTYALANNLSCTGENNSEPGGTF